MFNCCGKDVKSLCEQLECNVKETQKGVQIEKKTVKGLINRIESMPAGEVP